MAKSDKCGSPAEWLLLLRANPLSFLPLAAVRWEVRKSPLILFINLYSLLRVVHPNSRMSHAHF